MSGLEGTGDLGELGGAVQIAYAVSGPVEAAAREFSGATGAGPFLLREHVPIAELTFWGRGEPEPATMDHSIALGQWGEVMVELVEHHSITPSDAADALTRRGHGPHHVAMMSENLEDELARLSEAGHTLALRGRTHDVEFAFVELSTGGLVEVYQRSEAIVERYRMVREAAARWDQRELFIHAAS